MTNEDIQDHLNELGAWIQKVERAPPGGEFWNLFDEAIPKSIFF
jgi:hypothetical protein